MNGQCLKDITSGKSFDIFLECVDKEVGKYICRKRQTHACNGHLVYIAFPLPVRASPLSPSPVTPANTVPPQPRPHAYTYSNLLLAATSPWQPNPPTAVSISLHGWRCVMGLGLGVNVEGRGEEWVEEA